MRTRETLPIVCLVLAATLPYLNALGNGFAFDDRGMILENAAVHAGNASPGAFFVEPYYPGALYRPVSFLTYWLNVRAHGVAPLGFHLVNVALHALVTILVFAYARSIRIATTASFLAALVFAVHPIHTEAVTNIVGRSELLAAAAVLGALLSRPLSPLLFAVGLFCKESAFVFLPLLILTAWVREREPLRSVLEKMLRSGELPVLAAVGGGYLVLRWALFGTLGVGDPIARLDNPLAHTPVLERVTTAVVILTDYLGQLIAPVRLAADYSFNQIPVVESVADPRFWTALALLAAILGLAWRHRRAAPAMFAATVFFFAAMALTANLLFPIGTIKGERLLYLPSVGFCLFAGLSCAWALTRSRRWAPVAVSMLVLAYAGRTWARNPDWASDLALFTASVAASPQSAKAHHNLGAALAEGEHYAEAALAFRQALQLEPRYEDAAFGIGRMYEVRGMTSGALHWYEETLRIDPRHVKSHLNRGGILYNGGDLDGAAQAFRAGLDVQPGDPRLLTGAAFVLLAQNKAAEARVLLEQAHLVAPDNPDVRRGLELAQRAANPMEGS